MHYGVATFSRLLKIIGLFCRILSLLWGSFAKETYNFKELTNRSHPIHTYVYYMQVYICVNLHVNTHTHIRIQAYTHTNTCVNLYRYTMYTDTQCIEIHNVDK